MVGIDIAIGCQLQNLPHRSGKHPQLPPGLLREKQRFDLQLLAGLYQVHGVVAQPLKVPDGVLHFPHAAAILLGKRLRRKVHQVGIQPVLIQIQRVLLLQYHLGVLLIVGADKRDRPFQRIPCRPGHPEGIVVTLLQRHRRGTEQQQVGRVLHGVLRCRFVFGLHQPLAQLHQVLGKWHQNGGNSQVIDGMHHGNIPWCHCNMDKIKLKHRGDQQVQRQADNSTNDLDGKVDDRHPLGLVACPNAGNQRGGAGANV